MTRTEQSPPSTSRTRSVWVLALLGGALVVTSLLTSAAGAPGSPTPPSSQVWLPDGGCGCTGLSTTEPGP